MPKVTGPGGLPVEVDEFTAGYVEAAVRWMDDAESMPLDELAALTTPAAFTRMVEDCRSFQVIAANDLKGIGWKKEAGEMFHGERSGPSVAGFTGYYQQGRHAGEPTDRARKLADLGYLFGGFALGRGEDGYVGFAGDEPTILARGPDTYDTVDPLVAGYVRAALRMFGGGEGALVPRFGAEDLSLDALSKMRRDCDRFRQELGGSLPSVPHGRTGEVLWRVRASAPAWNPSDAWPTPVEDAQRRLGRAARALGRTGLIIGQGGKLEVAPERFLGSADTFDRALAALERTPWTSRPSPDGSQWARRVQVSSVPEHHRDDLAALGCYVFRGEGDEGKQVVWLAQHSVETERPPMALRRERKGLGY